VDGNQLVSLGQLGGNQRNHLGRDLELGEVDRRNAVLLREEGGEVLFVDDAELGEAVAEACARLALLLLRLLQLRERDQVPPNQQLTEATHPRNLGVDMAGLRRNAKKITAFRGYQPPWGRSRRAPTGKIVIKGHARGQIRNAPGDRAAWGVAAGGVARGQ